MNQETSCQVLVAQISDASKERVVIVGANGSRNSWDALGWACAEAQRLAGRGVAVLVSPATNVDARIGQSLTDASKDVNFAHDLDWVRTLRTQVQEYAINFSANVTFTHVQGDPIDELLRIAKFGNANLIAVGRSTRESPTFAFSLGQRLADNRDMLVIIDVP